MCTACVLYETIYSQFMLVRSSLGLLFPHPLKKPSARASNMIAINLCMLISLYLIVTYKYRLMLV